MASNPNSDAPAVITPAVTDDQVEARERTSGGRKWTKKLLDVKEAKKQFWIFLPMILTNVFYHCIPLISVMFAGHLGSLQLAGATLANSWASVTGFNFMTGLSGSLETLCGQGFGARQYNMLGIYLQSSCIISFIFSAIISIFWIYTKPILVFLHQDPRISEEAAIYIKYMIPGLFAFGFLQNMLRFFQTQSFVKPLILFSAIPMGIHFGVVYGLVHKTNLGFMGASLAASISLWISTIFLGIYLISSKKFEQTWTGFSLESFSNILTNLKLSLPSAAMVCLEFWASEILVFLAGLMPDSETSTSLIAICVNTANIAYMIAYGLSAAVSTRVSNELGAGKPEKAKKAMFVTFKLSVLVVSGEILGLFLGHKIWAGFFSNSLTIRKLFASMTPFLAVSIVFDSVQGVLSGVARACGWQHLAVCSGVAMFGFVGTPIAILLGFKFKLHDKGLWIGLICGLVCQAISLLLLTLCRNWRKFGITAATVESA